MRGISSAFTPENDLVLEKILPKCTAKEVTPTKYGVQLEHHEGLNTDSKSAE